MAKLKKLQIDPVSGKLSRLQAKDLPLVAIDGLNDGDPIAPFGTLTSDIIEYCIYDVDDNYLASGELSYPLPNDLDVGAHIRNLGFERGTYKVIYNFLRQIGGSSKVVLTKKSDRSIYTGQYMVETNGKIFASHNPQPDVNPQMEVPLMEDGNPIELLVQEDKLFLQEVSPSKTEIRIRPNPGIVDLDEFEKFRLLGYTCLSFSDVSGDSTITFDGSGQVATINSDTLTMSSAMEGGTLKIREAFIVDYDETTEQISRYAPVVDVETAPIMVNLVTNGDFQEGNDIAEVGVTRNNYQILPQPNPGNSKYVLQHTSEDTDNVYQLLLDGIPGETYIISCWVYYTQDWPENQKRLLFGQVESNGTFVNFNDSLSVNDTKEVGMTLWEQRYNVITIPENSNGNIKLNLGQTASSTTSGARWITNVQVEAGAVNGKPTPFTRERVLEEDIPTSGFATFTEGNNVELTLSQDDEGLNELMSNGVLTIRDAYVVDESLSQNEDLVVIEDIPINNPTATDVRKYEREFRVSPYHGQTSDNKIILQVDNAYDLYSVGVGGGETLIGSGNDWRQSQEFDLPSGTAGLRLESRNGNGAAGFIAKINYNGAEIKTGDGRVDFEQTSQRWQQDDSKFVDIPDVIVRTGPWEVTSNSANENYLDWEIKAGAGKGPWGSKVDGRLDDCKWIWTKQTQDDQVLQWSWTPDSAVTDLIWKYPDPNVWSDAIHPNDWSDGFNTFNYGGNGNGTTTRSHWHSGWLGYHAKWVQNAGQYGDAVMKFIDKNSQFDAPNHQEYSYGEPYGTRLNEDSTQPTTLAHRWMGISQVLPHKMLSQGIEAGDRITISWTQKSDTIEKGAMVGLYFYKESDGGTSWGPNRGNNPITQGNDQDGIPKKVAFEREFFRYIPVSKTDEWEQVSYTGVVPEDWDLTRRTVLYVRGDYGPEGTLLVENVRIEKTRVNSNIEKTPTTADLVGEIQSVNINNNTLQLSQTYEQLAPIGYVSDNDSNIRRWTEFDTFFIDYTSSLAEKSPIYGTLRGDIESINGTTITLKNTYAELGEQDGHDFENNLDINQSTLFNKWFIQYPNDNVENLSKLVKTGPNTFNLISNFKIDTQTYPDYPHAIVYKLYEPLSDEVQEKDYVNIVREMIPPIEETIQLVPFVEEFVSDIVLRTPEFQNVNSPIGAGQTEFQNYTSLVSNNANIKESIENEILSGSMSADINIDFNQFSNFIHFSSAEQRLRNFKTKLDNIELYTDRSASLAGTSSGSSGIHRVKAAPAGYLTISGSSNTNPPFVEVSGSLTQIQSWEAKRRDVINNFDKFEKYMFEQSSSYSTGSIGVFHENTWPKESGEGTYSNPYINYRTSQSVATTWYANQLVSASAYDKANKNRLQSHLPMFVQDDDENDVFLKFVDMIGHHFDGLWVFVKAMTDVHDKRDKLTECIAKNLLHPVAASLGWEVFDGKELISLPQYMFGMQVTGSESPVEYSPTPDRDISREIWSRIVSNIPYFLKTKGTSRAIKGLISCYGIPSSILRVMEYGGPKLPGQSAENLITRKFTKALLFRGASNNTFVQNETWTKVTQGEGATSRVPDTVEFRFKAASGSNQVLVRRGDDWAIRLKDNGSSDRYGYVSFMLSGSNGYRELLSSELPVYDGDFWSVMLTRNASGSGDYLTSDFSGSNVSYNLFTKQYDSGRSKIVYESSTSLLISGSQSVASASYNLAYSGSGTTVTIGGPEENTYFGESFSGSMMEYRNWTTPLKESAFDNHVASPIAFDGNHISASYTDLVTRYSFDDDKDLSVGANQYFQDVTADQSFTSSAAPNNYTSLLLPHFESVVDELKMKMPNLGPSNQSSRKIRIEDDERIDKVGNPVLKFNESITIPAYDKAPLDSNKLGIFFSPSAAINEDIISSFPNIDFDQYIGDPRDQYKENYTGLQTARNLYWKKYSGPNNFWDYLRLLKYYDASLYKQVHTLVPARANATVGILIEPTIFERDKIIIGKEPSFETQHHVTLIEVGNSVSESGEFKNFEDNINWSNPYGINKHKMVTGSYISSSAKYEAFEANLTYTDPFRVNYYTQLSGSEPRGFISASAEDVTPWGLNTAPINLRDPFRINNNTQETGSGIIISGEFVSFNAPSNTFSEIAAGTGSFVLKHILERPAIFGIGDKDDSGWFGNDFNGSTIEAGSVKVIFEEVVQPRIETNVDSLNNLETMFHYSSSLSASLHKPYSSSFVLSDLDNRWDEAVGTNRLFYTGCVQTDATTVVDPKSDYDENSPAFDTFLVSPTKLVSGDKASTKMEVKNK